MLPLLARHPFRCATSFKACGIAAFNVPVRYRTKVARRSLKREDYYNERRRKTRMFNMLKDDSIQMISQERHFKELDVPYHVSSINQILSHTVPLEPFAKAPIYSKLGLEQRYQESAEKFRMINSRITVWWKLRNIDPFSAKKFPAKAQQLFIDANNAQQRNDVDAMRELLTINVLEQVKTRKNKVIWKFVSELEPPQLANCRISVFNSADNYFAQITVRLNIKQIYAEYNESGQLIKGHPSQPEDVLSYAVFERPLKFASSTPWKICGKLPSQVPWQKVQEALNEKNRLKKRKNYKTQADRDHYREEFDRGQA